MDRRGFSTGLAAAGVLAGTRAGAVIRGDDGRDGLPAFAHVWLDSPGRFTPGVPAQLVIVSDNFTYTIGVDFKFSMENEERSSVLNPTLQRQFRNRVQVGEIRVGKRTIWIDAQVPVPPTEIRLTDFEISFRINGAKLASPYDGPIPVFSRLPLIGYLFRRQADIAMKKNLLAFVTPKILHFAV